MAYRGFKDLTKRTPSDKILPDKAFDIPKNLKCDGYQRDLPLLVYKCFDKKTSSGGIKYKNMSNKELAKELRKPINREFDKRKVNSLFRDNIWGADLTDMQLISKFNQGFRLLLCIIDIFS